MVSLVVSDHAELVGSVGKVYDGEHGYADTETGKTGPGLVTPKQAYVDLHGGTKRQSSWFSYIDTAERYNEPGKFTTLIGWGSIRKRPASR